MDFPLCVTQVSRFAENGTVALGDYCFRNEGQYDISYDFARAVGERRRASFVVSTSKGLCLPLLNAYSKLRNCLLTKESYGLAM
jgi:hypothetical protein